MRWLLLSLALCSCEFFLTTSGDAGTSTDAVDFDASGRAMGAIVFDRRLGVRRFRVPRALPALRRFIVAGQSNALRTDMTIVDAQLGGTFATAKVAQGASGFSTSHWLSTADGGPGAKVVDLLAELAVASDPRENRAIVWNQWEADTGPTEYPNYQGWLTNLIAETRAASWHGLRWILVLANADSEKSAEGLAGIRAAQYAIAATVARVEILDLDHLDKPVYYDGLHYTLGAGGGVEAMSALVGQRLEAIP